TWSGRAALAGVALGMAVLPKPVAWIIVPLAAVLGGRRHGPGRLGVGAGAALALGAAAFLPFAATGILGDTLSAMVTQLGAMPNVSNNAHNVWGLVALWASATGDLRVAGPLDLRLIGMLLFLAVYLRALARLWHDPTPPTVLLTGAITAFAFFLLSVHQHENHLFGVLPFLAALWVTDRRVPVLYAGLSATLLANMALHDPYLLSLGLSDVERWRAIEFYDVPVTGHADATTAFRVWTWLVALNILANVALFVRALQVAERRPAVPAAPGRAWFGLAPSRWRAVMTGCVAAALLSAWWVTAVANPDVRGFWVAEARKGP
ncbi:MAG: hypothetical protein AB7O28_26810, partial [Vicinamibacterales bacterium]